MNPDQESLPPPPEPPPSASQRNGLRMLALAALVLFFLVAAGLWTAVSGLLSGGEGEQAHESPAEQVSE